MKTPSEVQIWRRGVRARLLDQRTSVPKAERVRVLSAINARIRGAFPGLENERVAFYWPIRGEIDLRPMATRLAKAGGQFALPVITGRRDPLAFARWTPSTPMLAGVWNIPVPASPEWIQPTVLLIPVLGFDPAGYRLGYGGGFYDRTLSTMEPRPRTIGVGYALGRLETIYPQHFDVPLDAIVTESSLVRSG